MVKSQFKRCILFLADGARPDVLQSEMAKGNLPNLSRYLAEKGTNQTILTCFPSTTGPAYLPFLTGCYPGTCHVPGIRWFDKNHYAKKGWSLKSFRSYVGLETHLFNRDMAPDIKTVFEIFEKPVSILNVIDRGIPNGMNKTKWSRIWYYYYAHLTDHWSFVDEATNHKLLHVLDGDFDFIFLVYPSIDEYSHRSSPFHPKAILAYGEIDALIGKVVQKLKTKGMLEETLLILVSDHGLSETKNHFDVGPYLESRGIKTFFYTQIFKRNFRAASMISGNGMAHLYFRGEKGWQGRTLFEEMSQHRLLLDELRLRPEIDVMACQTADGSIKLLTERGQGSFRVVNGGYDYEWSHEEPLGLFQAGSRKINLSDEASLKQTFNSHYPDIFRQMTQLFSTHRTGDLVLSAKTGSDLRLRYEEPLHRGSHGAICPEHMKIPFLMNYPLNVSRPIRSVDVFPTMLQLLGRDLPPKIDGRSLLE